MQPDRALGFGILELTLCLGPDRLEAAMVRSRAVIHVLLMIPGSVGDTFTSSVIGDCS